MSARAVDAMTVDVAVVGAGPAGIAAAAMIAETGRRVAVLDESVEVGGQIWRHRRGTTPPTAARRWIRRLERSGATVLRESAVVDVRDDADAARFALTAECGVSPLRVSATTLVLATGARERFLPFPGWTLPGVVGVGGAQALLKSGLDVSGRRVVIAGSGPLLLPVAASLSAAGAQVVRVAEQAPRRAVRTFALGLWRRPSSLAQAARYRLAFASTPYAMGEWVAAARGSGRVEEVTITNGRHERTIACDLLAVAYGLVPNTRLARLVGCATARGAVVVDEFQRTSRPRAYSIGETTGIGGVDLALVEGQVAASHIVGRPVHRSLVRQRDSLRAMASVMDITFTPRDELRDAVTPDTIVCRCEDVPFGALRAEWSMRQAKLYTRAGMGPCQGRVCGAALEFLNGWPTDSVRIPIEPALLSSILAESADVAAMPRQQGASR
jgi:NADPH-dependent 2,4-dienoyl-CoA reductase/sulfur reductase-like enzyme